MHNIFVLLLSVCFVIIQGNAQYQPYAYSGLYQYPNYAIAGDTQSSPMKLVPENRFFWTWTSTTTSTSTTTCTVFANAACPGRRRRFLIDDSDDDIIDPSSVENKVEATQIAEIDSRKSRAAQPQEALDFQSYELVQSTFSNPYFSPNYNPYLRHQQPILAANPRFFLRFTTSTVTEVSTYSSRPACSSPSGFNQC